MKIAASNMPVQRDREGQRRRHAFAFVKMSVFAGIRFQRLRHDAYVGDARLLHRIHDGRKSAERHILIGAHKDRIGSADRESSARSLAPISLMLIASLPRNTRCCLSMEITSRSSVISLTVFVFGTETSMPDCSTGAVIMKMISSTSTTSTSGVTLISASELCVRPRAIRECHYERLLPLPATRAAVGRRALDRVHHFEREIIHARAELANRAE